MPRAFRDRRRQRETIERANQAFYASGAWWRTRWLGTHTEKNPLDAWILQEIIVETRPEVILETGTCEGGSALFLACICELIGHGEVISVDLKPVSSDYPRHPRISYLGGSSSVAAEVVAEVRERTRGRRTMVVLDSDHRAEHVEAELRAYSELVSPGCYLVVEDTNVDAVRPDLAPGPAAAVRSFLSATSEFEIDRTRHKYLITFNPDGYLRRRALEPRVAKL